MAAVSLSPIPAPLSAMSTRRVPLSSNPNVANSPLRGGAASLAASFSKQKRSYASTQREEMYGQHPPPAKKQMLNNAIARPVQPSAPAKPRATATTHGGSVRGERERSTASQQQKQASRPQFKDEDIEAIQKWVSNQRTHFPRYVFYFESVPDDVRARLARQLNVLGAREEKFFSIEITHVVTTRTIPKAQTTSQGTTSEASHEEPEHHHHKQPQTINPSLLSRMSDVSSAKRKLFEVATASRRAPINLVDDAAVRRPKVTRTADILERARDMGKKIWSLEKMQRVVNTILEPDPYRRYELASGVRSAGHSQSSKALEDGTLLQLLNKERASGPSDRDASVSMRELHLFKGPFIYVYDIEEKQRPIMVREYSKAADKNSGEWPQFRSAAKGRCPFVEDEMEEKAKKQARAAAVAAAAAPPATNPAIESALRLEPPVHISRPRPVTGKRSLAEMDDAINRGAGAPPSQIFAPAKMITPPTIDFNPGINNAFTSRARPARFLAGEPVASGLQPSGITSAIRSQMVSSTTGALGGKTGVSKEVMGLQRKVLQRSNHSTSHAQDPSSRRYADMSVDSGSFIRSASMGYTTTTTAITVNTTAGNAPVPATANMGRNRVEVLDEALKLRDEKHRRTHSVPSRLPAKPKKRDPKPGYCENCQDKFDDFDDHIQSRTHRKFAENDDNWKDLDALLGELRREVKYQQQYDEEDVDEHHHHEGWASSPSAEHCR